MEYEDVDIKIWNDLEQWRAEIKAEAHKLSSKEIDERIKNLETYMESSHFLDRSGCGQERYRISLGALIIEKNNRILFERVT